jgi:hypothetical protein
VLPAQDTDQAAEPSYGTPRYQRPARQNSLLGVAPAAMLTWQDWRHNGGSGLGSGTGGDHRARRPTRLLDRCRGASLLMPALGFTAKLCRLASGARGVAGHAGGRAVPRLPSRALRMDGRAPAAPCRTGAGGLCRAFAPVRVLSVRLPMPAGWKGPRSGRTHRAAATVPCRRRKRPEGCRWCGQWPGSASAWRQTAVRRSPPAR